MLMYLKQVAIFVSANALATYISISFAGFSTLNREPWRRILATLAVYPILVCGLMVILGLLGLLQAIPMLVTLSILALACLVVRSRRGTSLPSTVACQENTIPSHQADRAFKTICLAFIIAIWGLLAIRACFQATGYFHDDASYHATAPARWLVEGNLTLFGPFNYRAYFPLNAELLTLWFLIPFQSDVLVNLGGLVWATLGSVAIMAFGLSWKLPKSAVLMPVLLFLVSPVVADSAYSVAAVDLAGPCLVLGALAFLLPSPGGYSTPRSTWVDVTYAGLLAGFAAGCKVTFVPAGAIIIIWLLTTKVRSQQGKQRLFHALLFAACMMAVGGFWYIRNWILTGNPLYPASVGPFTGPFGPIDQARTKLITWIAGAPFDIRQWVHLSKYTDWPFGLWALSVSGYGTALLALWRRKRPTVQDDLRAFLLPMMVGLAFLVLYPFTPFSGTINEPDWPLQLHPRYLILPFTLGLVLFSPLADPRHGRGYYWMAASLLAVMTAWSGSPEAALAAFLLGAIWMLCRYVLRGAIGKVNRKWLTVSVSLVALAVIAGFVPFKEQRNSVIAFSNETWKLRRPIGAAWEALEHLPPGSRVTWFFGSSATKNYPEVRYYRLYGRHFHLVPCPVEADGTPYRFPHEQENRPWWGEKEEPNLTHFIDNLTASGINYVVVMKWDEADWPVQQAALESSPGASAVFNDGHSAIWKIHL